LGEWPSLRAASADPSVDDRHILPPPASEEAQKVEIIRGPNIVPPPEGRPLPDALTGRVLIVVGDDVSTGDMAPDGMGMSLWSNIPECARYLFRRQDPDFHDRAIEWGGGFVVGGHNYGQGSSREQAALSALHLGVRAVVAKSFARIHRGNLIAQGILPLTFIDETDYDQVRQDEEWVIEGTRAAVADGDAELVARASSGASLRLGLGLRPSERRVLLAGGTLKYLAAEDRRGAP
jgi:aconitate hydratase